MATNRGEKSRSPIQPAITHYHPELKQRTRINANRYRLFCRWSYCCTLALTLACFLGSWAEVGAASTAFSRIVVFGDSLSDTGNFYRLTGNQVPPSPYFDGRFSNGRLWIEYLAEDLGMQVLPEDNYAVAGATTGHDNSNNGLLGLQYPGLQDQIAEFLSSHQTGGADPAALYVVWIGANDFFELLQSGGSPVSLIANGVNNTASTITSLWQAGARHIVVVNAPDLGLTPFGISSGVQDEITLLCGAYNQALEPTLDGLANAGIPTVRVDAFATLRLMVNLPEHFGFTNVTEPFLAVGGDSSQFLFWDAVHPTTRGHEILANAARTQLIDYFSPRRGKKTPPAAINSLNGLVNAGKGTP
jgi:thermolabile hemolysin